VLARKNISIFYPVDKIIGELIDLKPDVIVTYPSLLSLLEKEITNKKISGINPKMILTTGETLNDSMREKLSKTLKSDIFRFYASEEFGPIAFECRKHLGYHVITDNVIVENIKNGKDSGPNETGEVILTGLYNYKMPLIRYKLGDLAILKYDKCECGRNLPLIKQVVGREDDILTLPSGKKISPRMINVIEEIPGISAYKTIQKAKDYFLVQVIKNNEFTDNTINEIVRMIKIGCLGEKVKIKVQIVKEISKERTGKIRTIVSKVN
jgi:phenylacetate-CoA ligase